MWDMDLSGFNPQRELKKFNIQGQKLAAVVLGGMTLFGCISEPIIEGSRNLPLHQTWEVQPGDVVAGNQVLGGLGDVAIATNGNAIYAPVDGRLQPHTPECVLFSSEEIPIYLFRLCGLQHPKWGQRRAGEKLGFADTLNFAVLTRRSDGKWAFIEPSVQILEQTLQPQKPVLSN